MDTTQEGSRQNPRTRGLIAGVAAGLLAGLIVSSLVRMVIGQAVMASALALPDAANLLGLSGFAVSFAIGALTGWIARIVSRGRSAAAWWAVALSLLLNAAGLLLVLFWFDAVPVVYTTVAINFVIHCGLTLLGAAFSLVLPPRRDRPVDHTFD